MYYCTNFVKLIHSSTVGWLFKVELIYHNMLPGCNFFLSTKSICYSANKNTGRRGVPLTLFSVITPIPALPLPLQYVPFLVY
jgi:hypothetical protein